jgi:CRP-like cAMP-binding protein
MRVRDRVRSHIYYAFRRHRITIPYPIQVQIDQDPAADVSKVHTRLLDGVEIFAALTGEQREQLAADSRALLFEAGQQIVREGEAGSSMFVLKRGEAAVTLAHTVGELARHREGGFFGEMSLLTGDARSATVTAVTDCELIEIGAEAFRGVLLADTAVVDRVSAAVATRRAELDQHRVARPAGGVPAEAPHTLVDRVRRFLRL